MPKKYYRKKRVFRKRRPYRKKRYNRRVNAPRKVLKLKGDQVMASRIMTKLKYTEILSATPTTSPYQYQFKINDLYDPNYTGAGHQPRGFDELALIYNNYRVHGCFVKVHCAMTTAFEEFYTGIFFHGNTTAPGDLFDISELKNSSYRIGNNEKPVNMSAYRSINRVLGKSKYVINNDDNYGAAIDSSPDELAYVTISVQNIDEATAISCHLIIELTFLCEFNNPKLLTQS